MKDRVDFNEVVNDIILEQFLKQIGYSGSVLVKDSTTWYSIDKKD